LEGKGHGQISVLSRHLTHGNEENREIHSHGSRFPASVAWSNTLSPTRSVIRSARKSANDGECKAGELITLLLFLAAVVAQSVR
jgi:hypothetical protein